jgi:hypothetical protein
MSEGDREVLNANRALFWDVALENIDLEKNANYVIERFLEYGTLEGVRWLRKRYGDDRLREFILKKRFRIRSPRTLNYWRIILDIPEAEWNMPFSRIPNTRS